MNAPHPMSQLWETWIDTAFPLQPVSIEESIVLLEILHLLHDLAEHFRAVLGRITVLNEANLDFQFQLVADVLIVQPIGERGFCVDNFFDFSVSCTCR